MKEIGFKIKCKDKVNIFFLMEMFMKEILKKIKDKDKEFFILK